MSTVLKTLNYNMDNNIKTLGRILSMCKEIKSFYTGIAEFPNLDFIDGNDDLPFISIYNEKRGLTIEFYIVSKDNDYFRGSWVDCVIKIVYDNNNEPKRKISTKGIENDIEKAYQKYFTHEKDLPEEYWEKVRSINF